MNIEELKITNSDSFYYIAAKFDNGEEASQINKRIADELSSIRGIDLWSHRLHTERELSDGKEIGNWTVVVLGEEPPLEIKKRIAEILKISGTLTALTDEVLREILRNTKKLKKDSKKRGGEKL